MRVWGDYLAIYAVIRIYDCGAPSVALHPILYHELWLVTRWHGVDGVL